METSKAAYHVHSDSITALASAKANANSYGENNKPDALAQLKEVCRKMTYKSFKDLSPGEYIINNFSSVETAHGKRVRILLDNGSTYMLLPSRFNFDDTTIADLNSRPKIMIYGGKEGSSVQSRLILDFQNVEYLTEEFLNFL